jgi:hypothetical protein
MSLILFIEGTLFIDFSKEHNSKSIFKEKFEKYSCKKFYNILCLFSYGIFFVFVNFSCYGRLLPICPHVLGHFHPKNFVVISYVRLLLKS